LRDYPGFSGSEFLNLEEVATLDHRHACVDRLSKATLYGGTKTSHSHVGYRASYLSQAALRTSRQLVIEVPRDGSCLSGFCLLPMRLGPANHPTP